MDKYATVCRSYIFPGSMTCKSIGRCGMGSEGDVGRGAGSAGGVAVTPMLVPMVGEGSGVSSSVTEVGVCGPHADKSRQIEIVSPMTVLNKFLNIATEDLLDLFYGF
jgi:hypothetical protein